MSEIDQIGAKGPLRVLIVDDSAVVRQALSSVLSAAGMEVQVAADPIIAMERIAENRPDTLILDIEMPRMDGLTFLRQLMRDSRPIPVLICSVLARPGTEGAIHALELGAVGIISTPRLGVKGFLKETTEQVVDAVRGAALARVRSRALVQPLRPDAKVFLHPPHRAVLGANTRTVVAVGASTGGTEALREILEQMTPNSPGMAIVQHMPEVFTGAFAKRLNGLCRVEVKEAEQGDRLTVGRALIARGNHHLAVRRSGAQYYVEVTDGPPVSRHRPSVDVLFRSAAQAAGPNAVGVILTGMGDDGAQGLLEMREAGAHTIAQDEATSIVFGMPKEAIAVGAACEVLPIGEIASAVLKKANSLSRSPVRDVRRE